MKVYKTYPVEFPKLRGSLDALKYPAFVEPKYDGELNKAICYGNAKLSNKSGKIRYDCPITNDIQWIVGSDFYQLLGELYFPPGHRGDLYNLLKNQNSDELHFVVFDIISLSTKEKSITICKEPLIKRKEILLEMFRNKQSANVELISVDFCNNKKEVMESYEKWIARGFEGAVAKSINSRYSSDYVNWVKLKKKDRSNFVVTKVDPTLERIEITVGGTKKVGVKCLEKYKKNIKVGDIVEIEYQGILSTGGLRHPVLISTGKGVLLGKKEEE